MSMFCVGAVLACPLPAAELEAPKDAPLDAQFLRDHAQTRGFMLGRPVKARPTPDGKSVLFLRAQPRQASMRLFEFDIAAGKTRELLAPEGLLKGAEEQLAPEEKARRERMRVSTAGFTDFQISTDGTLVLLSLSGKLTVLQRATGAARALKTGPGTLLDPKFSPDGKRVAYVRDHDVYVYDLADDKEHAATRGGSERLAHGLAEFVAQEEMDRFSGYWWSPDARSIVFEEYDAGAVEVWYISDPAHPERQPQASFYPRPGKANVVVRLGIVSVSGSGPAPITWIQWDAPRYPYLARVHWEEIGPLTITVQTRDQKELALYEVNTKTGATMPLVVEKDPAWVNLRSDVPRWLDDERRFLWVSESAGAPRLELRDKRDKQIQVLVPAAAGFRELIDLDVKAGRIVASVSTDPTQSHLVQLALEKGETAPLTTEKGNHKAVFAKDHSIYVQSVSLAEAMPRTTVHKADSSYVGTLESVAETPSFTPRAELIKVGDGQGFYATVVRPRQFDAKKRYPVIVDVYGGPLHNKVLAAMHARLLDQWLADQGFIVVSIDGRGTPGRGRDWERALYRNFGSVPLDDQVAGLKALGKRFPEMDRDRVGIVGWSFGGYLSALAVLKRPDVFKAAVAGAPVADWLDYDTHYTERYLGLPDKEPAAYEQASLLTYAPDLRRPLFLLHGTADDNVYFRHSLRLTQALFRAGKEVDVLPLSGLTHMVPDPVVNERLWSGVSRYFQKHLGKPSG